MKKKTAVICLVAIVLAVVVLGLVFKDALIRSYVSICRNHLQEYAQEMLDANERTRDKYGVWKTVCYPEAGAVEFRTGGSGLTPNTTYKGFYYSADNTHKPFAAGDEALLTQTDEDSATWTDGTDNHGISRRIAENWFWFEASF